ILPSDFVASFFLHNFLPSSFEELPSHRKNCRLRFLAMAKANSNERIEPILWAAADKLRGNLDAAEYKHVVLGLIFLKYISDAFEEKHRQLSAEQAKTGAN